MKSSKSPNRIIWYEIGAFATIAFTSWVASLLPVVLGYHSSFEWLDPVLETTIILLVAIPTITYSRRLLSHLHYLEGFLWVCAWCHKVKVQNDWIPVEEFLKKRLSTQTSHGICESCNRTFRDEVAKRSGR